MNGYATDLIVLPLLLRLLYSSDFFATADSLLFEVNSALVVEEIELFSSLEELEWLECIEVELELEEFFVE